ncbi:hypothetical protein PF005_g31690 [Phytophthora fragariae]|uniref:Secreted protein n=1 Tax=Phytophthora fragariae TaxID=53985 RepID=A0A6A3V3C8_9STRA|nr:hypothetical protein PF005_g31690 [Phytophthora fragariae]
MYRNLGVNCHPLLIVTLLFQPITRVHLTTWQNCVKCHPTKNLSHPASSEVTSNPLLAVKSRRLLPRAEFL